MTMKLARSRSAGVVPTGRLGLTLATLALLSACGGGADDPARSAGAATGLSATAAPPGVQLFGAALHGGAQAERRRALAAGTGLSEVGTVSTVSAKGVDTDQLLDWAEYKFADLFPRLNAKRYPLTYEGRRYQVREYTGAFGVRYLGVTDTGEVYGLGDFTNQALQSFGQLATWAPQVLADRCSASPSLCANPTPRGPLNACAQPAALALAAGTRTVARYALSGATTGEYAITTAVEGPGTFAGSAAVRIRSTVETNTLALGTPFVQTVVTESWHQAANGGLLLTLGADITTTPDGPVVDGLKVPGVPVLSRTVYTPADSNLEFTLAPGEQLIKATTATTTVGDQAVRATTRTQFQFEAQESVTVRGTRYDACRYLVSPEDSLDGTQRVWFAIGSGVPVRSELTTGALQSTAARTTTTELVEFSASNSGAGN